MKWPVVIGVAVAALVVGAVLAWTAVRQDREFQRLISEGDAAAARSETPRAIEAFSGAVALKPGSMLPYLRRGELYTRTGDLTAALRDLRRAAVFEPTAPQPVELLGDVNVGLKRYDRALDEYRRFLMLDDRSPRVLYKIALTLYRTGRPRAALEPLRAALAMGGRMAEGHYLLGLCLRDIGLPTDALVPLRTAITLNPALVPAREVLATLLADLGHPRDSIEQFEALAALEPDRAERAIRLADAYTSLGRYDAARLALARAAERHQEHPGLKTAEARVWLAVAERDPDERVRAATSAGHALEWVSQRDEPPGDALALYGRAMLLSGNVRTAERALLDAAARTPVEASTLRDLIDAATRLGHRDVARRARVQYSALESR